MRTMEIFLTKICLKKSRQGQGVMLQSHHGQHFRKQESDPWLNWMRVLAGHIIILMQEETMALVWIDIKTYLKKQIDSKRA